MLRIPFPRLPKTSLAFRAVIPIDYTSSNLLSKNSQVANFCYDLSVNKCNYVAAYAELNSILLVQQLQSVERSPHRYQIQSEYYQSKSSKLNIMYLFVVYQMDELQQPLLDAMYRQMEFICSILFLQHSEFCVLFAYFHRNWCHQCLSKIICSISPSKNLLCYTLILIGVMLVICLIISMLRQSNCRSIHILVYTLMKFKSSLSSMGSVYQLNCKNNKKSQTFLLLLPLSYAQILDYLLQATQNCSELKIIQLMIQAVYTQNSCQTQYLSEHGMIQQKEHYRIDYEKLYELADFLDQSPISQENYTKEDEEWKNYFLQNQNAFAIQNIEQFYRKLFNIVEWSFYKVLVNLIPQILLQKYLKYLKNTVKQKQRPFAQKQVSNFCQKYVRLLKQICALIIFLFLMYLNNIIAFAVIALLTFTYQLLKQYPKSMHMQDLARELYQFKYQNNSNQDQFSESIKKMKDAFRKIKRLIIYYQCNFKNLSSIKDSKQMSIYKIREIIGQFQTIVQQQWRCLNFVLENDNFSFSELFKKLKGQTETIRILSAVNKIQRFLQQSCMNTKRQLRQLFQGKGTRKNKRIINNFFNNLLWQIRNIFSLKDKIAQFECIKTTIKAFKDQLLVISIHFQKLLEIDQQYQRQILAIDNQMRQIDKNLYEGFLINLYDQHVRKQKQNLELSLKQVSIQQLEFKKRIVQLLLIHLQSEESIFRKQSDQKFRKEQGFQQKQQNLQQKQQTVYYRYIDRQNFQMSNQSVFLTTQGDINPIQHQDRQTVVIRLNKALENMFRKPTQKKGQKSYSKINSQQKQDISQINNSFNFKRVNIFKLQGLVLPKPKIDVYQ